MDRGKPSPVYIILSDTEDEDEDEEDNDETSNSSSSDENRDWREENDVIIIDDDDDDEEEEGSTEDKIGDSGSNRVYDDRAQYDQIVELLKGGRDLEPLKLEECKVYLWKHGLIVEGNKTVSIQRIQEHWRIKDGNGEKFYPRSSFTIDCTGDVCKGDVVIFTHRVFAKFDKVTRGRNLLGQRTIAGRIVKESYGTANQQHIFTVEVLWSKGVNELPPLSPLLVKGRTLYRFKNFRQRWDNEAERSKVLAEKHKRGAAARREYRARKKACSKYKALLSSVATNNGICGSKRKRHSPHKGRSLKRCRNQEPGPVTRTARGKRGGRRKAPLLKQLKPKKNDKHQAPKTHPKNLMSTQSNENGVPILGPYSVPMDVGSALHASGWAFFSGCKRRRRARGKGKSRKRCRNQEPGLATRTAAGKHGGGQGKAPLLKQRKPKKNDKHQPQKTDQSNENGVSMLNPSSLNNHHVQSYPVDIGSALTSTTAPGHYAHAALSSYQLEPWSLNYCQNQVGYDWQYSGSASELALFNAGLLRLCGKCCRRTGWRCPMHQK